MINTVFLSDVLSLLCLVADRGWRVSSIGLIRDFDCRCPICALVNEIDPSIWSMEAAHHACDMLGIDGGANWVGVLMAAADEPHHPLRPRLMKALGMEAT